MKKVDSLGVGVTIEYFHVRLLLVVVHSHNQVCASMQMKVSLLILHSSSLDDLWLVAAWHVDSVQSNKIMYHDVCSMLMIMKRWMWSMFRMYLENSSNDEYHWSHYRDDHFSPVKHDSLVNLMMNVNNVMEWRRADHWQELVWQKKNGVLQRWEWDWRWFIRNWAARSFSIWRVYFMKVHVHVWSGRLMNGEVFVDVQFHFEPVFLVDLP